MGSSELAYGQDPDYSTLTDPVFNPGRPHGRKRGQGCMPAVAIYGMADQLSPSCQTPGPCRVCDDLGCGIGRCAMAVTRTTRSACFLPLSHFIVPYITPFRAQLILS